MSDNQAPVVDNSAAVVNKAPVGNVNVNAGEPAAAVANNGSWYDDLDADLKAHPSITKFKNKGDLAKSYVELQKTLGKDKIVVPTDKSTPDEWRAYFKAVGAPDKEDEYSTITDDMPEAIRDRKEALDAFRKAAYEQGVTKKQFDAIFGTYKGLKKAEFEQGIEKVGKMREASETELRREWGAAYEAKVDGAQKVINTFFKDKAIRPEFSVLANDKGFIAAMADIAERLGEDVIAGKPRNVMTPQEAQSELNSIMGDPKSPWRNELHPEHDAYVQKVIDLQRMAMAG
jgi:hypothetical protein